MSAYVILRQSHTTDATIDAALAHLKINNCWQPQDGAIPQWVSQTHSYDQRENFARASAFLVAHLAQRASLIVIVDEIDAEQLNPKDSVDWSGLVAMLVLAFPEVRWTFLAIRAPANEADLTNNSIDTSDVPDTARVDSLVAHAYYACSWRLVAGLFDLRSIADLRGSALFDGYGLRRIVCERMQYDAEYKSATGSFQRQDMRSIPRRRFLAVVLDDETDFSGFEALMAYTRGFRVHAISSWAEADKLLGENGLLNKFSLGREIADSTDVDCYAEARRTESEALLLSIEDLFLHFPDQSQKGLSRLDVRATEFPALSLGPESTLRRRFITSGYLRQSDKNVREQRRQHLDALRQRESVQSPLPLRKADQLLHKPASGIYTLWDELGLARAFANGGDYPNCRGCAPGFVWPPAEPGAGTHDDDEGYGHSSPGRLLQIAQSLLERAATLANEADTLAESVRGAVLATQALEILGGRTPTLSLDALRLKHRFEISAECHFAGVEYHLSIEERLADIARNLESIAYWLHPTRKAYFVLNAQARIITELIPIFTNHGAFEEAEECRNKLRSLNNRIGFHVTGRRKRLIHLLSRPFNAYTDWVLRSSLHFIGTIILVFAAFVAAFQLIEGGTTLSAAYSTVRAMLAEIPNWSELGGGAKSLADSVQEPDSLARLPSLVLNCLAAGFGLLNFGLLLSYLYNRIARK